MVVIYTRVRRNPFPFIMAIHETFTNMCLNKKHKKHKKDKHDGKTFTGDRPPGLKLILKVGNSSTPEHSDSPGPILHPSSYTVAGDDESSHSTLSFHKKAKKKKKKKERDREKHEKKKKHHKEKRKKIQDESSQDGVSMGEESLSEPPPAYKDDELKQEFVSTNDTVIASAREPRVCVLLRQRHEKTPLQRMLEYLQKQLEKKDPQQFFAWPVTDQIAPGYSHTISHPMDFSTMRQKIEDNSYQSLTDYITDLRLMCNNAMIYNHPDTIYYKAAKRLLHGGLKLVSAEKLKQLSPSIPGISQIPKEQLGFHFTTSCEIFDEDVSQPADETDDDVNREMQINSKRKVCDSFSENQFEAIPDDLTSDQILEQAQRLARANAEKLSVKKPKTSMGFLRQQNDGSTSLAIFVPGEGVDPERPGERSVPLGQLVGKLSHGSGQLQGFKEDRRNIAKTVKPLNYGAFGSYAPSYDSTFANLSKEESDLLYETYGDENATVYAESILNFGKDCDYTLAMVDNLLDLLTGGEHRKTKCLIDEQRKFREEEERVRELMETKHSVLMKNRPPNIKNEFPPVKIEIEQLKTLSELGIDTSFLSEFEGLREAAAVQDKLDQTTALLEKLQQVQNDRLSAPPPAHLSNILQPSETELHLAEKITESLSELAKQVPPGAIIPVPAIRKAMGIVPETTSVSTATSMTPPTVQNPSANTVVVLDGDESSTEEEPCVSVGQLDLESELREFLESDTALSSFPLHDDDKTIEEMLSES